MANTSLIDKLYEKWESVEQRPSKGAALDTDCNPCAQSVAVMEARGMGKLDFKAFVSSLGILRNGEPDYPESLDTVTAKTLGISTIHAILLRRFNDFSSENPGIALKEPWKILGANWRQVLRFWRWVDSLTPEELQSRLIMVKDYTDYARFPKETQAKAERLREKVSSLDVITADLYYYGEGFGMRSKPKSIREWSNDESPSKRNDRKAYRGLQDENGNYSPGFLSWITAWDFMVSNGFSSIGFHEVKDILAYVTWEIQTLSHMDSFDDLFFCKVFGYNPLTNGVVTDSSIVLKSLNKRITKIARSLRQRFANRNRNIAPVTTKIETLVITKEILAEGPDQLMALVQETKGDSRSILVEFPFTGGEAKLESSLDGFLKQIKYHKTLTTRPVPSTENRMAKSFIWEVSDTLILDHGSSTQERIMKQLNERRFNSPVKPLAKSNDQ